MAVGYVAGETDQERRQLGVIYRLEIFTGCWFSLPDMPRRKRRAKKQSEKPAKMAEEGEKKDWRDAGRDTVIKPQITYQASTR
jgi:hypothetical protein